MKTVLTLCTFSIVLYGCSSYDSDKYGNLTAHYGNALGAVEYDDRLAPSSYSNEFGDRQVTYNPSVPFSYSDEKEIRKILFSAYLTVEVDIPDTASGALKTIAKKYGGYVQESGSNRTIIRVRSEQLQTALEDIAGVGHITNKNVVGNDITDEYLDIKIRLDNALKARERYLQLLEKAENVEATLKVEKELERLNETIDRLKGRVNKFNHLSEYSTITVTIEKKSQPGILGYIFLGMYYSVKWLFVMD